MLNKKSLIIFILVFLLMFTACSSNDEETIDDTTTDNSENKEEVVGSDKFTGELEENVTLKVLENDTAISKGYFQELLDAFNAEYEEYGIKAVDANVDQHIDLANDGPYGYGPDVLYQANDVLMRYSRDKHILPLPIEEIESIGKTSQMAIDAFKLELGGNEYFCGVHVNIQAPMLYYRKDLIPENWKENWDKNENEIPDMIENWNDMYRFSKLRNEEGSYGYMQSLNNVYFSSGFLFSYGAYIFGDNNTDIEDIGFSNGEAEKGAFVIQQLASNMNEESIDDTITTNAYSKLGQGEYFATITTPDVYSTFIDDLIIAYEEEGYSSDEAKNMAEENLIMTVPPRLPASGNLEEDTEDFIENKTMGGINGYAISSYTESPNAALAFVDFATSYDAIKLRHEKLGIAPTRTDLSSEIGGISEELLVRLEEGNIVLMPSIPELTQIWTPLGTYFGDITKDVFRSEGEKKYENLEDLKDGLEKIDQQIYDAIHTLN